MSKIKDFIENNLTDKEREEMKKRITRPRSDTDKSIRSTRNSPVILESVKFGSSGFLRRKKAGTKVKSSPKDSGVEQKPNDGSLKQSSGSSFNHYSEIEDVLRYYERKPQREKNVKNSAGNSTRRKPTGRSLSGGRTTRTGRKTAKSEDDRYWFWDMCTVQ